MFTTPVLQLNPERVREIDPRDVSSLFGMWTVFNRCALSIPDGRRLENMSWRVWARETLCCPPQPHDMITPAIDISPTTSTGVPSLSGSIDTEPDEDSALSKSRGKEPHLNSKGLQKIVFNIHAKSELEPLSPTIEAVVNARIQSFSPTAPPDSPDLESSRQLQFSTDSSCVSTTTAATASTARQSEHRDSETSVSSNDADGLIRSGSVVKGFSPVVSSFRSTHAARLNQHSSPRKSMGSTLAPSKAGMFTLGGSSEDEGSSFDSYRRPLPNKRGSSNLAQHASRGLDAQTKTTSFRDIVEQRKNQEGSENDEGAIASDSDEDEDDVIDSAISEEDEDDWEEMATDDEKQPKEAPVPVFKRIDSRPNLVSRRSILTQGLTEGDRARGLMNAASQSTSAIRRARATSHNGPSMPGSPDEQEGMMMQGPKSTKPLPIIPTTTNTYAMAQSPRATRRAMLSTELTESLRKNMLLERQGKQANLSFMRRQAASMANLQRANGLQQPSALAHSEAPPGPHAPAAPATQPAQNNASWTEFDNPWEYHTKGW